MATHFDCDSDYFWHFRSNTLMKERQYDDVCDCQTEIIECTEILKRLLKDKKNKKIKENEEAA